MPLLPALASIVTFFSQMFVSFITWIISRLTYKLAIYTAALTALSVALNSFYDSFSNHVSSLALSAPAEFQTAAMFLPSNIGFCMGLIITAEISAAVYKMIVRLIELKLGAAS